MSPIRIGIDLGGTKIEALAIDAVGNELARRRIVTPRYDYGAIVAAIHRLVVSMEASLGHTARVGIGTPGAESPESGLVKNANSTELNGRPFRADLCRTLDREVRLANDADCLALSEAVDGAGAGHRLVFGVILGTGVGGGFVLDGRPWKGPNAIAGEWGHNEMPSRVDVGLPNLVCWCGRRRCIEAYVSGPALAADHARHVPARTDGAPLDARQIAALAATGDPDAAATLARHANRLAGALATVVNVLDPDVIVIGGGLSQIDTLCADVERLLPAHVFSDRVATRVVRSVHGDASGVRGAAWLWPA